jgi:methionyl-tRNA formyltransferase
VFAQKVIDVSWFDNGKTLYEKSLQELFLLFIETYGTISKLEFSQVKKNYGLVSGSYHNEINMTTASQIVLDQKYVARDLLNLMRARTFEGKPGCTFTENGKRYTVRIEITEV